MKKLLDSIEAITQESLHIIEASNSLEALEMARVEFLGRKGAIARLMPLLAQLSLEEKRVAGPAMNHLKEKIELLFETKKNHLHEEKFTEREEQDRYFDVTAYINPERQGSLHPYTHVTKKITDFFVQLGFQIADGPEVETEWYNFEALNIPVDHPARDMQDTFWLKIPRMLMRTQTSNVQIHAMQKQHPPLALICPGRVYRQEATDASHDCQFQQIEGILINKDISLAHLITLMKRFLQTLFNNDSITLRIRPGFFPFVEPGIEIDASCPFCIKGCSTCKQTRWIEMAGAGLIHPNVLKAGGIDPEIYSGFAFGLGLTRLVMLTYTIPDIRLLHGANVEFLKQF